jgi:Na+/proline symporter
VWYPGAEPGGGSYIAQRMLAARSEKDALAGTLWFNLAHYALRPWPWIIVALASMVVFPKLEDIQARFPSLSPDLLGHDLAYPAMLTLLPHGLLGLLIASLLAAYVSTMTTHMNWGASYLVNDFYRRFVNREVDERTCVWLGRAVSALLMVISGAMMFALTTAGAAFELMLSVGAGTGLIYLLRWFWWRINAWSEIAAMVGSFGIALAVFIARERGVEIPTHRGLLYSVFGTTVIWLTITFITPMVDRETLIRFYRLVRPAGPGWTGIRESAGVAASPDSLGQSLLGVMLGCATVYGALFGVGFFLYGNPSAGAVCAVLFTVGAIGLMSLLRSMWRGTGATA